MFLEVDRWSFFMEFVFSKVDILGFFQQFSFSKGNASSERDLFTTSSRVLWPAVRVRSEYDVFVEIQKETRRFQKNRFPFASIPQTPNRDYINAVRARISILRACNDDLKIGKFQRNLFFFFVVFFYQPFNFAKMTRFTYLQSFI